jgi:probable addiction module antidote protein
MLRANKTYAEWRIEKLADPERAARYLNAAKRDSKEAFLHALKNVIQANQVARVAREAGVSRESVYRSFSTDGNPTFDTLSSVLEALNIDISFVAVGSSSSAVAGGSSSKPQTKPRAAKSTAPRSANLVPSRSIIGAGLPVTIVFDCSNTRDYISLENPPSVGSSQANLSLANAIPERGILGFLPGFLQQQQMKEVETFQ